MSYIQLCDIGKIYAGDSGIAVGIRSVNLSFDKGEFVAISGQSGSGKSTLLNIISGMDTYEEGEMLVEGEPTSHFIQQDFEEYRKKYISFIFQDYNIIESFTVLQNVELALMHIENRRERRKRALELLDKVGMRAHLKHRGSQLSGGQKQRTVIARALAKDSPIILADEPTGNLDSKTSEEIIQLLHDVSKDKLVIIVTHDFEEVEKYATRHIRIFDGGVEFDHVLKSHETVIEEKSEKETPVSKKAAKKKARASLIRNSMTLGRVRFFAMPKLTVFICMLMILSSVAVTFVTGTFGNAMEMFKNNYLFTHHDGRLVLMHPDKSVMSDSELQGLADKYGAKSYVKYDYLYDVDYIFDPVAYNRFDSFSTESHGAPDLGRYPESENEVLLYIPIYMKGDYNEASLSQKIFLNFQKGSYGYWSSNDTNGIVYKIVGIKYFYDNTKRSEIVLSEDGYDTANAISFFFESISTTATVKISYGDLSQSFQTLGTVLDFDAGKDEYYYISGQYSGVIKEILSAVPSDILSHTVKIEGKYSKASGGNMYDYFGGYYYEDFIGSIDTSDPVVREISGLKINNKEGGLYDEIYALLNSRYFGGAAESILVLNPESIKKYVEEDFFETGYYQSSLFFKNDRDAEKAAGLIKDEGYQAAPSTTVIEHSFFSYIEFIIGPLFACIAWIVAVIFIGLLLALCTTKAMQATSSDIAILRTMGIPVSVIKASIYVQTMIAIIPAYIATALFSFIIYTNPTTNEKFTFLHAEHYALIALGLVVVVLVLSQRYVKRIFGSTVKKTLKGGGIK